jgi:hypothetical protein
MPGDFLSSYQLLVRKRDAGYEPGGREFESLRARRTLECPLRQPHLCLWNTVLPIYQEGHEDLGSAAAEPKLLYIGSQKALPHMRIRLCTRAKCAICVERIGVNGYRVLML